MEKEVLVKVEGVCKKFSTDLKKSLGYALQDIGREMIGKPRITTLRKSEFLAVNNISFELRRGECLGLIGHNGAGKSTLLKMLNGLIKPDAGRIEMRGRVAAMIELGAGFNPILSGRENIFNNASILGFTREETETKFESIIEFSELRDFIDAPVQSYSSGMKVRLAFAVAAHLDPDILIIDEVLAVGDLGFVLKCFKRIDELLPNTAVIFVSHNMPMISRICSSVLLMEKGQAKYQGTSVSTGIDQYFSKFAQKKKEPAVMFSDASVELHEVLVNGSAEDISILRWNDDLQIKMSFQNHTLENTPYVTISIFDKEQKPIAMFNAAHKEEKLLPGQLFTVELTHKKTQLARGVYSINIGVTKRKGISPILRINDVKNLQIQNEENTWTYFLLDCETSVKPLEKTNA